MNSINISQQNSPANQQPNSLVSLAMKSTQKQAFQMLAYHICIVFVLYQAVLNLKSVNVILSWIIIFLIKESFEIYYYIRHIMILKSQTIQQEFEVQFAHIQQTNVQSQQNIQIQEQPGNNNMSVEQNNNNHHSQMAESLPQNVQINQQETQQNPTRIQIALSMEEVQAQAYIDQIESEIRQEILHRNNNLSIIFSLSLILSQVLIIFFAILIYKDTYLMKVDPLPHFFGNADDISLNLCLILFAAQLTLYCFFYITAFAILLFLPVIIIFGVLFVIFWIVQKLIFLRKIKKFSVRKMIDIPEEMCECAICMQKYDPDDKVKTIGCPAQHSFHQNCIDNWFTIKSQCPLCRYEFN